MAQGEPLYEAFYGLREQPFALSTDPRFLFLSASHRRAYDELLIGLRRREGILLLTGETGTGKTTLCRAVIDALGPRTFSALSLNPYMCDAEVLRVVLRDFGLVSRDEIRRGALAKADMPQLLDTLESFLRSLLPLNSYAVLVIDEAQSLAPAVLDQVRMLGGYEQDGHRLLQIVLVGQPALAGTVRSDPLRALNERITRRLTLSPLTPAEIAEYIKHRLGIAGGRDAVAFLPDAVALIGELSYGLPRRINVLCDRALEEGRVAGAMAIDAAMVKRAARSIAGAGEPIAVSTLLDEPVLDHLDHLDNLDHLDPLEPAAQAVPDISLRFGQLEEPRRSRARVIILGVALLLLAGATFAGGYVHSMASSDAVMPPLPPEVRLTIGAPPPVVVMPSDEEVRAGLAQARAQQQEPY